MPEYQKRSPQLALKKAIAAFDELSPDRKLIFRQVFPEIREHTCREDEMQKRMDNAQTLEERESIQPDVEKAQDARWNYIQALKKNMYSLVTEHFIETATSASRLEAEDAEAFSTHLQVAPREKSYHDLFTNSGDNRFLRDLQVGDPDDQGWANAMNVKKTPQYKDLFTPKDRKFLRSIKIIDPDDPEWAEKISKEEGPGKERKP